MDLACDEFLVFHQTQSVIIYLKVRLLKKSVVPLISPLFSTSLIVYHVFHRPFVRVEVS